MPRIEVEVTHGDRVLFPADGITKRDVVDYYCAVADTMLPYLKGRPLNVQRFPRGIGEKGFLQQDFADSMPDWMSGIEVDKEGGTLVHPVAERPEALGWLANQNCIALHIWQSRRARLHDPDRLVFDLDPSGNDFAVVRAAARATAAVLDDLGLTCYVQTTGSRGLHVVVPLRGDADFDTVRQFARDVAEVVAATMPRTEPWKPAKTTAATASTSTSCETPTRRQRLLRIRYAPAPVRRWPPRWNGTNWARAACGRIGSPSATSPNAWPSWAIRGPGCSGTPAP
jgi:DNA ligase D-like protein (predicted polymerase)